MCAYDETRRGEYLIRMQTRRAQAIAAASKEKS